MLYFLHIQMQEFFVPPISISRRLKRYIPDNPRHLIAGKGWLVMADEDKNKSAKDSDKLLDVKLVRVVRTTSSESYMIWQDDTRLGQVDVHLGVDLIHATLILEKDLDAATQAKLIEILDLDVVSSHMSAYERENFLVTVWRGTELESFSDGEPEVDDDDDDDEEEY